MPADVWAGLLGVREVADNSACLNFSSLLLASYRTRILAAMSSAYQHLGNGH